MDMCRNVGIGSGKMLWIFQECFKVLRYRIRCVNVEMELKIACVTLEERSFKTLGLNILTY